MSSAASPEAWGEVQLVWGNGPAYPPALVVLSWVSGAVTSGFRRPLPSSVTGPRLLNGQISSVNHEDPTVKDSS